jgi:Subtilase family
MAASKRSPAPRLPALSLAALVCLMAVALASPASGKSHGTTPASITSQLLVKPRPGAGSSSFRMALDRAGAKQTGVVPELGVRIVHVAAANRGATLRSLRSAAAVAFAEPNGLTPPAEVVPNDVWWASESSQIQTHADKAWDVTSGTSGVKVAVLDSGVDLSQPDLTGNLLPGRDFYNNDSDPSDDNGHGTAVAGVAAGRSGNGVGIASYCGGCSILPGKITGSDGYATWSAMASGITWAADQGARVINLSFAGSSGSTTVRDAIAYAHSHGAVITVAAGNSSSSSQTYPAAYPGALAIAAADGYDGLASYSNYGSWVQLAAPGCNYATKRSSTTPLFSSFCGTSSAAPTAAGIAALAFSYNPSATNAQVEQALEASAAPNSFTQYGRIDAWGTLAALGAISPAPTAPLNGGVPVIVTASGAPLSGAPQPNQTLAASSGRWSGAPSINLAFQWRRCDSAGANCSLIAGATYQTYTPTSADSGYTLRTTVTATNSLGSASAVSPSSPVVGGSSSGSAPSNTSMPAITGIAQAGATLSAATGSWSGSPTSYAYQWSRCDSAGAGCTSVVGATSPSYQLSAGDVGATIRVTVTAINAYGSSSATSAQTSIAAAAPVSGPLTTTFTGSISSKQASKSFYLTVGSGDATATLTFSKASSLTVTLLAADGSTVGTVSGASGVQLSRTVSAGTYRYVVSGSVKKGSAAFSLAVSYPAP